MRKICLPLYFMAILCLSNTAFSQKTDSATITMPANTKYQKSAGYQNLWGHNYRKEWTTPVEFPIARLDTLFGGLTAYKQGGGNQSKSLRFKTADDKKYAMRSVNKSLRVIVPKIFHDTWIEKLADDEISMSHPYAALTVPPMAAAAGIYHTTPIYVYVPKQPRLDTFQQFGDQLYLLEQRPDDDWSNAPNLGRFSKFYNSDEVREKMFEDNKKQVDQVAFAKARIFDMFLGDWDRHEEQWKWGKVEKGNQTVYVPIPVDRDQAYAKYDGLLLSMIARSAMPYFQSFDYTIPYPEGYSFERRNVDRFFTNRVTLEEWQTAARQLQASLTDAVIESGIRRLPKEIFALSGQDIIDKLKRRREDLPEYARRYYTFLAKTVDIVGSEDREYFEVKRLRDGKMQVNLYDMKDGMKRATPYWTRTINPNETNEIRLYGLSGRDTYKIEGESSGDSRIRIIGGNEKDSIVLTGYGKKVHIYDNKEENVIVGSGYRKHLSSDSAVHAFDYDNFRQNKKAIKPAVGFNNEDRIYVGLSYTMIHQSFRKKPFAAKNTFGVNYSISQKAFSASYAGIFPQFVGNWGLLLNGNYDPVRWTNFFGLGNETKNNNDTKFFYQLRTKQNFGRIGLTNSGKSGSVTISGAYNSVEVINDKDRFYQKNFLPTNPKTNKTDHFATANLHYNFAALNDSAVPEKGVNFTVAGGYNWDIKNNNKSFADVGGRLELYVPLISKFSLALIAGGATISGTPEFYQYPNIGGGNSLRGFRRERFWGKSTFFNSNELRFLTNMRTRLMNGKIGLVAFYDHGRVWMPGEKSNTWHNGYGGGLLLAPFNMMLFDVTYGKSDEGTAIQLRVTQKFRL
jgi:hypothetical protein